MKISQIVNVLFFGLFLLFSLSGCERSSREVDFSVPLGAKIHIFASPDSPANAGLPGDAKSIIINSGMGLSKPVNIDLGQGVQIISQLKVRVTCEYHADTANNPATLEFIIKDKNGKQIGSTLSHDFRPENLKKTFNEEFSFDINQPFDQREVIIEVNPISAGDFGFYIYSMSGTMIVH